MNGTPFINRTAAAESTWNIQAERLSARAAAADATPAMTLAFWPRFVEA